MKAIVLGGLGIMGLAAQVYLRNSDEFSRITVVDRDPDAVQSTVTWLNDSIGREKFHGMVVELTDYNAMLQAVCGHDIVINCAAMTGHYLEATRAALEAGAHYIDVGSFGEEKAQLALAGAFSEKGRTAVLGMGFTPGLVNIAAAYGIERLTSVDSIDIRWAIVDIVPPSLHSRALYGGFAWWGYLHNYFSLPSTRWKDGRRQEFGPRHEPEQFEFKGPIGNTEVAGWPGYDSDSIARSYPNIPNIESKAAVGVDTAKKWELLRDLGFNQVEPINVQGQQVVPWSVLEALLNNQPPEANCPPDIRHGGAVLIKGKANGRQTEYRIDLWPSEKLIQEYKDLDVASHAGPRGVYRVGTAMGSAAVLIAQGKAIGNGVFYPEAAFAPEQFLDQEAASGICVEISKTTLL